MPTRLICFLKQCLSRQHWQKFQRASLFTSVIFFAELSSNICAAENQSCEWRIRTSLQASEPDPSKSDDYRFAREEVERFKAGSSSGDSQFVYRWAGLLFLSVLLFAGFVLLK